jgi:RNA polymerase sigma-70 factor (ECF subfamily)
LTEAAGIPDAERSDIRLVADYLSGDEHAFGVLVDRYAPRLRGMCWRYLHDDQLVEDVLQETLLRLFQTMPRIDSEFNVSGWIHRIAVNLCLDELRRRARLGDFHPMDVEDAEAALAGVVDADCAGRPHEAFDARMTRELIRVAAAQLPPRQRTVLVLRDVRGVSQADAAEELGISVGAVQGILFRARERFRAEYVYAAGLQDRPADCATTAFTLENVALGDLRRDRLSAVRRHLDGCADCKPRFNSASTAA